MRHVIGRTARVAAVASLAGALAATGAGAQALGPQRQFLALEPYYSHLSLDGGGNGASRVELNGYGGRLWINLAPFSGKSPNLVGMGAIALFMTYTPDQGGKGITTLHYGLQHDVFFVNRPLGGFIDPLVSVAAGAFRFNDVAADESQTKFALTPGIGVRLPLANRFQLRVDGRDALIFGQRANGGGKRTTNNFEYVGALGITF